VSWRDLLPEAAHILRRLIDAASPNPPGDCEAVSRVCVDLLERDIPGLRVLRAPDGTPNVLASLGSGNKTLLIHSHYDTQPSGDPALWSSDPYRATLRDGKIYGRGAGDDKGSVAVQMAALLNLARGGFDPPFRLLLAFVADEESGGERGTVFLREAGELRADAVLIGEQTDNQVAIGERGIVWIRVEFTGKAAHGAIPEAGASALAPAAWLIDQLHQRLMPELRARQPTPLLPASSLTIGRCDAGSDVSTVPATAVVELDRRIVPGEDPDGCVAEVTTYVDAALQYAPGITARMSTFLSAPAFLTPEDSPLVQSLQDAVAATCGPRLLTGYRQASDARFFAPDGVPIVIFGPSDPAVGHAADEHIAVDDLQQATEILIRFTHDAGDFLNHPSA
jgi:acetylornithine deacetylase/succinyl-diaminopimelate desuccinylase family protein